MAMTMSAAVAMAMASAVAVTVKGMSASAVATEQKLHFYKIESGPGCVKVTGVVEFSLFMRAVADF
jgi:hypothetical protein